MDPDSVNYVASAAVSAVVAIAVAVTGIMASRLHRRNDPARGVIAWLKGAYALLTLLVDPSTKLA